MAMSPALLANGGFDGGDLLGGERLGWLGECDVLEEELA